MPSPTTTRQIGRAATRAIVSAIESSLVLLGESSLVAKDVGAKAELGVIWGYPQPFERIGQIERARFSELFENRQVSEKPVKCESHLLRNPSISCFQQFTRRSGFSACTAGEFSPWISPRCYEETGLFEPRGCSRAPSQSTRLCRFSCVRWAGICRRCGRTSRDGQTAGELGIG